MLHKFILNIKLRKKWYHKVIYNTVLEMRRVRLPFPKFFGAIFYHLWNIWIMVWRRTKQIFIYDPMFRYRCASVGKSVYFELNFPLILGYGTLNLGDNVIIGGNVVFIVSYKVRSNPTIMIGDDVYIGYETLFSCADSISVGNKVRIAEGCRIFDNNNHPIDPVARAKNAIIGEEDIAPVIIEDGAWIGTRATILKGITVGRNAVVATEAVVTKDVPANTVVAGNPARIVKTIEET